MKRLPADAGGAPAAVLSLVLEHKRGHGALYDAVNQGRIGTTRLRRVLAGLPLSRAADRRLMLGDGCEQFAEAAYRSPPAGIGFTGSRSVRTMIKLTVRNIVSTGT